MPSISASLLDARETFHFLLKFLYYDIVLNIDKRGDLFDEAVSKLTGTAILDNANGKLRVVNVRMAKYLTLLVEPFVRSYFCAIVSLLSLASDTSDVFHQDINCKRVLRLYRDVEVWEQYEVTNDNEYDQLTCVARAQSLAQFMYECSGSIVGGDSVSSDSIKNGLNSLVSAKHITSTRGIVKERSGGSNTCVRYSILSRCIELQRIAQRLERCFYPHEVAAHATEDFSSHYKVGGETLISEGRTSRLAVAGSMKDPFLSKL